MKTRISILTLLFVLLMTVPVMADVNFDINGRAYKPATSPILEEGITSGSAQMLARTLGANLTVDGNQIILTENENVLQMTVGNLNAKLNGEERLMPRAPQKAGNDFLLPVRFIYEAFGAEVEWMDEKETVVVNYEEARNEMTAEEMIAKSSLIMQEANSYKMSVDMDTDITMNMTKSGEEPQVQASKMNGHIDGSVQYKPLLMYMVQNMNVTIPDQAEKIPPISTEMLINKDGLYMTVPEQGWLKMEIPGMDMQKLMEQSMAQDPLSSMQQMKDMGMAISYNNDAERDGQKYWVIDVTMGADSINQYMQSMGQQIPGMGQEVMDLYKNMALDMTYATWINQKTMKTDFMQLQRKISFGMDVPEEGTDGHMNMDMDMNANYKLYDYGVSFKAPDVSNARDFNEVMEQSFSNK